MANSRQQFMGMYDEVVDLLKRFKQSNDGLNKSIGVEHDSSISLRIKAEQPNHNEMIKRLDGILQKLEQSYLDPDTARKIGTVKQQYKIQKDRRAHIIRSLNQMQEASQKMPHQTSQSQAYINYRIANTHHKKNTIRRQNHQQERLSNSTTHTINKHNQEQITEYDYQIECKLLKEKKKALEETEKQILNVYNITKDCHEMVQYQGEHIDIISDHIYKTQENTLVALKQLKEANQHNKKRRKKIIGFSLLLIIAVIVLFSVLFF